MQILITVMHLYVIQLYIDFFVELIRRSNGNGDWNMQIVIFKTECLIVACLYIMHSPITFC
jgi:heme/copper-type cytochrome/quinol oxidase subunit 4